MPNTLGTAETSFGSQTPGIFSTTGNVFTDIFGSVRESLVNGIPQLIDGLISRELGNEDPASAGFAQVGDNRAERVAPQDTAPRSVVPFVDLTDRNTQLTIGTVAAVAVVAFVLLRR